MSHHNDTKKIEDLDQETLDRAIEIVRKLQAKMESGIGISKEDLHQHKDILTKLLEYLILNYNNPDIDVSLIDFLAKALGINIAKEKDKEREEKEEELSEEQKKIRHRQIMYEAYKILNPHRIAGETSLENFISNVLTRGIEVARKYEGAKYEDHFTKKELNDLESYKESFVKKLRSSGHKGHGRGL